MSGSATLGPRIEGAVAVLQIDERVFPLDVVYGAARSLLDRAYLRLARDGDALVKVELRARGGQGDLRALSGDLANELLNQCIRHRLGDRVGRVREAYMARSFSDREATLDALLAELDDDELADDSLEVDAKEPT